MHATDHHHNPGIHLHLDPSRGAEQPEAGE
jgi:hypothetical protein